MKDGRFTLEVSWSACRQDRSSDIPSGDPDMAHTARSVQRDKLLLQENRQLPTRIVWLLNPLEDVRGNERGCHPKKCFLYVHRLGVKPFGCKTVRQNINTYYL